MTIEQVLDLPADELDKVPTAEWVERFTQYFTVTRPELAPRQHNGVTVMQPVVTLKVKQNVEKLKALGIDIDISDFNRRKR